MSFQVGDIVAITSEASQAGFLYRLTEIRDTGHGDPRYRYAAHVMPVLRGKNLTPATSWNLAHLTNVTPEFFLLFIKAHKETLVTL